VRWIGQRLARGAQLCGWLVQNCVQPVHNLGKTVDLNGELSLLRGCYLEERYLHLVHKLGQQLVHTPRHNKP
jgi:hypothetical protein